MTRCGPKIERLCHTNLHRFFFHHQSIGIDSQQHIVTLSSWAPARDGKYLKNAKQQLKIAPHSWLDVIQVSEDTWIPRMLRCSFDICLMWSHINVSASEKPLTNFWLAKRKWVNSTCESHSLHLLSVTQNVQPFPHKKDCRLLTCLYVLAKDYKNILRIRKLSVLGGWQHKSLCCLQMMSLQFSGSPAMMTPPTLKWFSTVIMKHETE